MAERYASNCWRKRSTRCASGPTPSSGPPSITSRVGSPAVWESMIWIASMSVSSRGARRACAFHPLDHCGAPLAGERQARWTYALGAASHEGFGELDGLYQVGLGVQ